MVKRIRKNNTDIEPGIPTLISKGCVVNGNIRHALAIRIEGTLLGDILDAGNLIIGEDGTVTGNVNTKSATIFGRLNGDVVAAETIEIKSSGKISGRLRTKSLSVEPGALYDGKIAMGNTPFDTE